MNEWHEGDLASYPDVYGEEEEFIVLAIGTNENGALMLQLGWRDTHQWAATVYAANCLKVESCGE